MTGYSREERAPLALVLTTPDLRWSALSRAATRVVESVNGRSRGANRFRRDFLDRALGLDCVRVREPCHETQGWRNLGATSISGTLSPRVRCGVRFQRTIVARVPLRATIRLPLRGGPVSGRCPPLFGGDRPAFYVDDVRNTFVLPVYACSTSSRRAPLVQPACDGFASCQRANERTSGSAVLGDATAASAARTTTLLSCRHRFVVEF